MGRGVKEGTGHTRGVWQRSKGNGMVNTEVSGSKTFVVGQEKRASTKPKKEPVDERPEAPDRAAASVGFPITWKARESLCPGEGAKLRKMRVPSRAPAVPGRLPLPITPRAPPPLGAVGHAAPWNSRACPPVSSRLKSSHRSRPGPNATAYVRNFLSEKLRIDLSFLHTHGLFKYFFFLKIYIFFLINYC